MITSVEPKQGSKRRRVVGRLTTAGLIVLALLVALVALGVLSGNYQIRPILSGSMRPGFPVGGVVISKRVPMSDIKVRDVIVFTRPNNRSERVVHRIIKLDRKGSAVTVKTQGDANPAPDPWTLNLRGDTAYRVRYSIPLLGYPAVWYHSSGRALLLVAAGLVIVVAAVSVWRHDRAEAPENEGPS